MFSIPDAQAVADLEGGITYLKRLPTRMGKLGPSGSVRAEVHPYLSLQECQSGCGNRSAGGFIIQEEQTPQRPVSPIAMIPTLACPLLALFGEEDRTRRRLMPRGCRKNSTSTARPTNCGCIARPAMPSSPTTGPVTGLQQRRICGIGSCCSMRNTSRPSSSFPGVMGGRAALGNSPAAAYTRRPAPRLIAPWG